jgi:hypothetical protein
VDRAELGAEGFLGLGRQALAGKAHHPMKANGFEDETEVTARQRLAQIETVDGRTQYVAAWLNGCH